MFKKLLSEKPWFVGGVAGVVYFFVTLLIEGCPLFKPESMCGLLVAYLNLPTALVYEVIIKPYLLPLALRQNLNSVPSLLVEMGSIAVLNFILGAIIFSVIAKLWKRNRNA